jgi:hypothetical protein
MPRMRILLTTFLMLSAVASAQNWPSESGLQRDGFRGSIEAFDRFRTNDNPRVQGEELRDRVGGWAGAVRGWFEQQGEKVGQNENDSARYFGLRREWEGDLGRRR